jgi:hypothetical protein
MNLTGDLSTHLERLLAELPEAVRRDSAGVAGLYAALHGALRLGASLAYQDAASVARTNGGAAVAAAVQRRGDTVIAEAYAGLEAATDSAVAVARARMTAPVRKEPAAGAPARQKPARASEKEEKTVTGGFVSAALSRDEAGTERFIVRLQETDRPQPARVRLTGPAAKAFSLRYGPKGPAVGTVLTLRGIWGKSNWTDRQGVERTTWELTATAPDAIAAAAPVPPAGPVEPVLDLSADMPPMASQMAGYGSVID